MKVLLLIAKLGGCVRMGGFDFLGNRGGDFCGGWWGEKGGFYRFWLNQTPDSTLRVIWWVTPVKRGWWSYGTRVKSSMKPLE